MDLHRWLSAGPGGDRRLAAELRGRTSRTRRCRSATSGSPAVFGEFTGAAAGQLPVLPPVLRRADAEAAAPGGGGRLPGRDADQPEQPRAGRRPGHGPDGEGGRGAAGRDVRAARAPGPPDHQRHDRQPGGAVRRPRAAPRPGRRLQRRGALHPRPDVRRARHRGHGGRGGRRGPDGPGRSWTRCWRAAGSARSWPPPGTTGLGAIDPVHEVLAVARRHGVRVHVDAAYGGFFTLLAGRDGPRAGSRRPGRPSAAATRWWSTRTSTGCSPTAAARCCSPTPRSAGSTCTTRPTPTSPPTSCTWARSAWSARGRARRRPRCG